MNQGGKYFALEFKFMLGQEQTWLYGWVTNIQLNSPIKNRSKG